MEWILGIFVVLVLLFAAVGMTAQSKSNKKSAKKGDAGKEKGTTSADFLSDIPEWTKFVAIAVLCHILVAVYWWSLWWSLATTLIFWIDHVVAVLVLTVFSTKDAKGNKRKMPATSWLIFILVAINIWSFGGWASSQVSEGMKSASEAKAKQEEAQIASLPKEITAPVGDWSEKLDTLHGEEIVPHGPIFLQNDKHQVYELDDAAKNSNYLPVMKTNWLRFKSRTSEPVRVTISR